MVKKGPIVAFLIFIVVFGTIMGATTKNILDNIKLGLDLQGGFEILYEVSPAEKGQKIDEKVLASTAEALDKRVNVLGVSEPNIQTEGNNRIRVQLAGVKDQNKARKILSTEANLSFRDVNDKKLLDGSDLAEGGAKQTFDDQGRPCVSLKLKSAEKFKEVTQKIVNMGEGKNFLVIWLDFEEGKDSFNAEVMKKHPKFLSAPRVEQVFNQDTVQIVGNFTIEEAKTLASLLNAGALPVKLNEIYSTSVGAQFGEQALQKTVIAGIIGVLAVYLFMIFYYRFPGFIAAITLTVFNYLTLLIFDWMHVVLTLPGIAALILGVGMAVDANIITYERIREEIKVGRSIKAAFKAGNQNSISTVTDANLTTLLAGVVLFFYGTSSVKGFATSLIISILISFITNVYLSRWLLGLWVDSGILKNKPGWFGVKKSEIRDISENIVTLDLPTKFDRFDFVKYRRKFFLVSGILLAAGIIVLSVFRLNLAIDFTSGTRVELLSKKPLSTEKISAELKKLNLQTDDIVLSGENKNIGVARFKGVLSKEEISKLKMHFDKTLKADTTVSTVTPTVGKELAKNALVALMISSLGLIVFVTFRFELPMAVSAVIALLYATFFVVPFFSVTRLEVDITFIAALLTIVGYSINDTIVTFDRMRENMQKRMRLKSYEDIVNVVNTSIRQTLGRSVNTVLMVILTVIALLIFGSESIRPFSIALVVGLVVGTYSSIFIAAQLWVEWKYKELKKKGVLITYKEKRKFSDEPQV
ncbi:protein translocase subunit SecDF [Bacillus methanolicus]|uniref:Multifunctional fusion protein n=1 Tax=Bacillus methanolicus (strain MGA3 / ATCC 53907) TaxID=796606 RepID=I3EAV6_BACMM|nr:protein translocase subunit SecDF [Bacillus methanolicus]AIE60863.1 Protein translocase subunit SecDF [Bacillus methanolicus MGA3]EIJ83627.1 bifunctional preprotein translocase subunit SecD/SecF [Bacillus methanolicus MGA3]